MGRSRKGSGFEREIARKLSVWWSGDPAQDDVFWRTAGSGARATVRGKRGQLTGGHHGDLSATDDRGQAFIRTFTVEIKRGYSGESFGDLLDVLPGGKVGYLRWLRKLIFSSRKAGTPFWLVIVKRDRRRPLILFPLDIVDTPPVFGDIMDDFTKGVKVPVVVLDGLLPNGIRLGIMRLDDWLLRVLPDRIRSFVENRK